MLKYNKLKELIRKRENIKENEEIPLIIKTIDEMKNYELAMCDGGEKEFYYDFDRNKLKTQLNTALNKDKVINKNIGDDSYER